MAAREFGFDWLAQNLADRPQVAVNFLGNGRQFGFGSQNLGPWQWLSVWLRFVKSGSYRTKGIRAFTSR